MDFLIISSAGKPIYSTLKDESKTSSTSALIQAIIDTRPITCIKTDSSLVVILRKGPISLIAIAHSLDYSISLLNRYLNVLYNHIIFTLTQSNLERIFSTQSNFDLRQLLHGSEIFLDNLVSSFTSTSLPIIFNAIKTRKSTSFQPIDNLIYGIIYNNDTIYSLIKGNRKISPLDVSLIINTTTTNNSFKSSQHWIPICLPSVNENGFLYAYICFKDVWIVLVSNNSDKFFEMSRFCDDLYKEFKIGLEKEFKLDCLLNFLVLEKSIGHYFESRRNHPYKNDSDWMRLILMYDYCSGKLESCKIVFVLTRFEYIVGMRIQNVDYFAAFGPLIDKKDITIAMNELVNWVKRNDVNLFIRR